jgi:hypothetical protein
MCVLRLIMTEQARTRAPMRIIKRISPVSIVIESIWKRRPEFSIASYLVYAIDCEIDLLITSSLYDNF